MILNKFVKQSAHGHHLIILKRHGWNSCAEVFQTCPMFDTSSESQVKYPCFLIYRGQLQKVQREHTSLLNKLHFRQKL